MGIKPHPKTHREDKMKKTTYNKLKEILENNTLEEAIEMIDKKFCIKEIPYFPKRVF